MAQHGDARDTLQVRPHAHDGQPGRARETPHIRLLAKPEFNNEAPFVGKTVGGGRKEPTVGIEAVASTVERLPWFETRDFRLQRGFDLRRHVRGIGDDQIEGPGDAVEEVRQRERDSVVHPVSVRVAASDQQCCGRDVGGHDVRAGYFQRERHREAAASGADVHHRCRPARLRGFECLFDDQLAFGTGNQHVA